MIAQDLTKFVLFTVLLGIILAIAIFRPPLLPVKTSGATESQEEKDWAASLQAWEKNLADQASLLGEKEDGIAGQLAAVQAERARLAQEWEALEEEKGRLAQGWENLRAEQARLAQELENLEAERARFAGEMARLWERETDLAAWETKVQGLLYWSVAALVGSGLMAVPSTMVLVALRRQDRRMSGREAKRAPVPYARQGRRATQPTGMAPMTAVPTYGGNGRTKESVAHHV